MRVGIAVLGLLLAAGEARAADTKLDPAFEAAWASSKDEMLAGGVTKEMFVGVWYWAQAQYQLGRCAKFLDVETAMSFRNLLVTTEIADAKAYPSIDLLGVSNFKAGLADAKKEPLSPRTCDQALTALAHDTVRDLPKRRAR